MQVNCGLAARWPEGENKALRREQVELRGQIGGRCMSSGEGKKGWLGAKILGHMMRASKDVIREEGGAEIQKVQHRARRDLPPLMQVTGRSHSHLGELQGGACCQEETTC